jgi:hypothetical protein
VEQLECGALECGLVGGQLFRFLHLFANVDEFLARDVKAELG